MLDRRLIVSAAAVLAAAAVPLAAAGDEEIARTASGRPDISGHYNVGTLTPLARPQAFGDNLYLTREEADRIAEEERKRMQAEARVSDPNREAPPEGGDGSPGAAGNVGGYNAFWIDRGTDVFEVDGKFRTSIIIDPKNGRYPPLTDAARERFAARRGFFRANTGEAWWLEREGPGPYDDPELRPLAERCLLGFSSTGGPPMLPALYNNLKRIVQTEDHVMILVEMVHDARVVRIGGEHVPASERRWMGDSIGWWEGDTLVVDTANFSPKTNYLGAAENLRLVERFTRVGPDAIRYAVTFDDPTTWARPWTAVVTLTRQDAAIYEFACHEGNAGIMLGILGAARQFGARNAATWESPDAR